MFAMHIATDVAWSVYNNTDFEPCDLDFESPASYGQLV